jgi:hypothetical protein
MDKGCDVGGKRLDGGVKRGHADLRNDASIDEFRLKDGHFGECQCL